MPVALLPPVTNHSGVGIYGGTKPLVLLTGPAFVRSARGRYWHRPRSGVVYPHGNASWLVWCGMHLQDRGAARRETPPMEEENPVCGSCEGRAFGSGQLPSDTEYETRFVPRGIDPPTVCPGSRKGDMYEDFGRVGRCLVCSDLLPLRGGGGWARPTYGTVNHPPGPGLVDRCDLHGWSMLVAVDGQAICMCGGSYVFVDRTG